MKNEYSWVTAKRFLLIFYDVTGLFISLNQFVKFCRLYTGKHIVNFYNVDYNGLHNFILDRTDIPLK